jgi:hypothetical protein
MKFYISQEIFEIADNHDHIDDLIRFVVKGRHELMMKNEDEISRILDSAWAEGLGANTGSFVANLLQNIYKRLAYQKFSFDVKIVTSNPDENNKIFLLENAIIYLNQPISIILENSYYDKFFLKSLFKNFTRLSQQINFGIKNYYFDFVNGGGKNNIPNVIKTLIQKFSNLNNSVCYLRACVIIDSDKPNPTVASPNQEIISFCDKHKILIHILYKREVENYIPLEYIPELGIALGPIYNLYLGFNETQKDFYNLKDGFNNARKLENLPEEIRMLFNSLNDDKIQTLRKGLKNNTFNPTQDLSPLFENENVTEKTLKFRTKNQPNPNELEDVLKMINSLL